MGMGEMFTDKAELNGLLQNSLPIKISNVHHSTSFEVDENGAEAASATGKCL